MSSFAELQAQAYSDLRKPKAPASAISDTPPVPIQPTAVEPPAPAGAGARPDGQPKPEAPAAPPPPEVKLDAVKDVGQSTDDDAKRKAHEAAEAKRRAEFDARQAEKKAARQAALDKIAALNSAELLAAAAERVAADTERLTRRNMKEAVAEHIQARCREDTAFAMLVMDPVKSMINCFQYINRKAQGYAEQEMKDNGVQRTGVYGLDVPDGLCFQWAEDYFKDENAKEDHQDEEKFVPKPYVPASAPRKTPAGKAGKKPAPAAKPRAEKAADSGMEQISLM